MKTHTLGFPRIDARRELRVAMERHWSGVGAADVLPQIAADLRGRHWLLQRHAGLDFVTSDFSYVDLMLDTAVMFGATPARFGFVPGSARPGSDRYFQLVRGNANASSMKTAQWFGTDDEYTVPELSVGQRFELDAEPLIDHVREIEGRGFTPKPVLIGPLSFLWLSTMPDVAPADRAAAKLALLPSLLEVYRELLTKIESRAVGWVQIDEPVLTLDLPAAWLTAFDMAYKAIARPYLKVLLATSFESVAHRLLMLARLPVAGLHVDLVQAPEQAAAVLAHWPRDRVLSAGVIDGRSVWKADQSAVLARLTALHERFDDRLWLAPSCSLQHGPVGGALEDRLDPEIRQWLTLAAEKLDELMLLKKTLRGGGVALPSMPPAALPGSSAPAARARASVQRPMSAP